MLVQLYYIGKTNTSDRFLTTFQDLRKAYTYSVFSGSIPLWLPSDVAQVA
ncbi:hypothetical protein [Coleofasciculus sp. H7-2]